MNFYKYLLVVFLILGKVYSCEFCDKENKKECGCNFECCQEKKSNLFEKIKDSLKPITKLKDFKKIINCNNVCCECCCKKTKGKDKNE